MAPGPGTSARRVERIKLPNHNDAILVFGATGLVGRHLVRQATAAGRSLLMTSRAAMPVDDSEPRVRWLHGPGYELHAGAGPWPTVATVLSVGPLDALAAWLQRTRPSGLRRLIALSSTSAFSKQASMAAKERELAARLQQAEAQLASVCAELGADWTVLRPTLIWGDGRDRNLSVLAAQARRLGFLPLPAFATGRRQPIHAAEVATAVLAACNADASRGRCLDLPGGEIVAYDEMARRVAACVAAPGRILRVPSFVVRPGLALARKLHWIEADRCAAIARMAVDLVYDGEPAWQALGIRPGTFHPTAGEFRPA